MSITIEDKAGMILPSDKLIRLSCVHYLAPLFFNCEFIEAAYQAIYRIT